MFQSRVLRELGGLSYCVYLIHISVVEGTRRAIAFRFGESTMATHFLSLAVGVVLILAIAKVSWMFFEQPMLRRGHAFKY
jgi:peptidoglycan/LPS O-acetylase OafA/YrhL